MFPLCSAPTAMTTTARLAARAGVMRVTARQRKRNTRPRSRDTSADQETDQNAGWQQHHQPEPDVIEVVVVLVDVQRPFALVQRDDEQREHHQKGQGRPGLRG